jgi:hypothetical protein
MKQSQQTPTRGVALICSTNCAAYIYTHTHTQKGQLLNWYCGVKSASRASFNETIHFQGPP